ncbi:MAG: hypothetical protein AB7J35_00565 [Dehalococcoidia bacterium]
MPMSRHRPALAAILVAFVAAFVAFAGQTPASAAPTSDNPVVQRALRDLGTYQGECWQWMKAVVADAAGAKVGFDYRYGYLDAGAVEVSLSEAGPGDIIQIADDSWSSADADYPGLHTAIVISNNGDGTFEAIDSNQNWDGVVNLRPGYDPSARAAAAGLDVHVYRFGSDSASLLPAPAPVTTVAGPVTTGDKARVNTPGDCLRLRATPSGTITHCLGHGTQVTVTGEPRTVDSTVWVPVSTAAGTGWMAMEYLLKEVPSSTANPSGTGPVTPIFRYRAFVAVSVD